MFFFPLKQGSKELEFSINVFGRYMTPLFFLCFPHLPPQQTQRGKRRKSSDFGIWVFPKTVESMGLSNFPTPSEGVLPLLVVNTVLSVALLKNMVRSLLQWVLTSPFSFDEDQEDVRSTRISSRRRRRRISISQFRALSGEACLNSSNSGGGGGGGGRSSAWLATTVECCVCLCGFEAEEEVSELSCKHFFHKGCLQKWFDNQHTTCPLCRSIK